MQATLLPRDIGTAQTAHQHFHKASEVHFHTSCQVYTHFSCFFTTGGAQHLHSMSDGVALDLRHLHSFHIPLTFGEAILMYIQDCQMAIEANRSRFGFSEG